MYSGYGIKCSYKNVIYVALIGTISLISAVSSKAEVTIHLKDGAKRILRCDASKGSNKVNIKWKRSDTLLKSNNRYIVSDEKQCNNTGWCSQLTIKQVIWADNDSLYECVHMDNRLVTAYHLFVQYDRKTHEAITLLPQKRQKLFCPITVGDYNVTLYWYKDCGDYCLAMIHDEGQQFYIIQNSAELKDLPRFYICQAQYEKQNRTHTFHIIEDNPGILPTWALYLCIGLLGVVLGSGLVCSLAICQNWRRKEPVNLPPQVEFPRHKSSTHVTRKSCQTVGRTSSRRTVRSDSSHSSGASASAEVTTSTSDVPRRLRTRRSQKSSSSGPSDTELFTSRMDEVIANAKKAYKKQLRGRGHPH